MNIFLFLLLAFFSGSSYSEGWRIYDNNLPPVDYPSLDAACQAYTISCPNVYDLRSEFTGSQCSNGAGICNYDYYRCSLGSLHGSGSATVYFNCSGQPGKVPRGTCPNYYCGCPEGQSELSNGTCGVCPSGQVENPNTGKCQAPCTAGGSDPPWGGIAVGLEQGTTCEGGCLVEWIQYYRTDPQGFTEFSMGNEKPGQFCSVGSLSSPPVAPPRSCSSPNVIRSDGTCGTPDPSNCPAWQEVKDHQCQDKPCADGETLKCGTVNDAQVCSCSGASDCEPGTVKNAFGNCVAQQSCPAGQVQDSVTGVCGPPKDDSCPSGTHREGMTCAKDPGECQVGTWYIPGCGCVSDVNQCVNRNSNDLDGDGTPNANDDDADGDGTPNANDSDADNDGIPNSLDSTPAGPGSSPMADPSKTRDTSKSDPDGDLDGDGDPNGTDPDRDGDGVPNGDDGTPDGREDGTGVEEGQCDPETEECSGEKDKPGKPAEIGDPFYKKKEDRSFQQVWSAFIQRVQQANIVTAGSRFFTVSIGGGSCPNWVIPSTFISPAIPITLQCSSEVTTALRVAGYMVLIIAAWVAFRIALL